MSQQQKKTKCKIYFYFSFNVYQEADLVVDVETFYGEQDDEYIVQDCLTTYKNGYMKRKDGEIHVVFNLKNYVAAIVVRE